MLILFVAIAVLATAELVWWVTALVQTAEEHATQRRQELWSECYVAAESLAVLPQMTTKQIEEFLAQRFAHLAWQKEGPCQSGLATIYPGYGVSIRSDALATTEAFYARRVRMFVWEGSAFFIMLMVGVGLIVRTLRREMDLLKQQANFVSAVTHEFKSPLAAIKLFAETMQMREVSEERRKKYLQGIRQDVDRLETLVTNVMAVARFEAGGALLHLERTDLVRDVRDIVSALQKEMGLEVAVDVPDEPIWVTSDLGALQTVLRNILDNAVKYGEKPIKVRVEDSAAFGVVQVSDSGMGLASDEREKIFERFYRVGDEMVREKAGSGLGLYLVRTLVQTAGGEVFADSAGLGQGTTITVKLPKVKQ